MEDTVTVNNSANITPLAGPGVAAGTAGAQTIPTGVPDGLELDDAALPAGFTSW